MSRFLVQKLQNLVAYTPGEQPKINEFIKLNTNESPFSPPKKASEIVACKVEQLNIYCDNACKNLTEAFTSYYNISKENVIFGNGSDEILAFSFLAFCDENIGVCYPEISYGFYKVYSKLFGIKDEKIPLKSDFSIEISNYFAKNKTIIIANPNAPTGIALNLSEIEEILTKNPNNIVIIDEAYVDFGADSAVKLIDKYENLIVCGTFSKSRNLAGARLGFAIASKELIDDLNKIKYSYNPYNVNALTQIVGEISIKEDEYFKECINKIINTREKFVNSLEKLGFVTLPSKANFVFTKNDKISGEELYKKLKERKILVRHFTDSKISDFVRVSIGTDSQMNEVLKNIEEILEESHA